MIGLSSQNGFVQYLNHYNILGPTVIPGGPEITEQSIQSVFQDFALINSYFLHFVG